MWRHPDYERLTGRAAPATAEPAPPEPQGETLFEAERSQGAERLRVSFENYEGHPFVRLQVWARNAVGDWWPKPGKCVSIRLREVSGLVEALEQVEERAQYPTSELRQARPRATPGAGGGPPNCGRAGRGPWRGRQRPPGADAGRAAR
jgi:hypothetical protein